MSDLLFDDLYRARVEPIERHLDPQTDKRTQAQADQILSLLRTRRASNVELAAISLKYTSRISDLRKRGYVIVNEDHDRATGLSFYRLVR